VWRYGPFKVSHHDFYCLSCSFGWKRGATKGSRLNLQEEFGKGEAKKLDEPDEAMQKIPEGNQL
jgi:hypothetical protein